MATLGSVSLYNCEMGGDEMAEAKPTCIFLGSSCEGDSVPIYQCQKQWDELQETAQWDERFCDHCRQTVHRVVDVEGFQRAEALGQCVMVAGYEHGATSATLFVGKPGSASHSVTGGLPSLEN